MALVEEFMSKTYLIQTGDLEDPGALAVSSVAGAGRGMVSLKHRLRLVKSSIGFHVAFQSPELNPLAAVLFNKTLVICPTTLKGHYLECCYTTLNNTDYVQPNRDYSDHFSVQPVYL